MISARRGFTLMELAIVLAVMGVAATLVVPALGRLGRDKPRRSEDQFMALLHDARKSAIDHNALVTLRVDPLTGRYRADTTTSLGSGLFVEGKLELGVEETLVTPLARLTYIFRPTGAVFGDSVLVRGSEATVLVGVDPWSGVAYAHAR